MRRSGCEWKYAAIAATLCVGSTGCASASLLGARPKLHIAEVAGASITGDSVAHVDLVLNNDERQRITFSTRTSGLSAVEPVTTPLPDSLVPVVVVPGILEASDVAGWRPGVPGAPPEAWLVWAERGLGGNWPPGMEERVVVQPPRNAARTHGRTESSFDTNWAHPGSWAVAALLPIAVAIDVATLPVVALPLVLSVLF